MSYGGFLLKIGEFEIPQDIIAHGTYKANINKQDIDDYTDANGYLHRNTVNLRALKVEFETKAMIPDSKFQRFMDGIRANLIDDVADSCYITAYIPRLGRYETQFGYLVDLDPQIWGTKGNTEPYYEPMRFAFVGGVYNG